MRLVLADESMADEIERTAADYRETAAVESVEVCRAGTTHAVRAAFREPATLVHFVGHCDPAGLRCRDGWVDLTDLETAAVDAFVLNACGSYDQGLALVERGCAAGAVTVADVLDEQAATVGRTLVRLLCRGFEFARATHVASLRILMSSDYVVVGDGTFRPFEPDNPPAVLRIRESDAGYRVSTRGLATDRTGHRVPVPGAQAARLNGDEVTLTCSSAELDSLLDGVDLPVIYDGELYWSGDLVGDIGT